MRHPMAITSLALAASVCYASPASALVTLQIQDYVEAPITGLVDGKGSNEVLLARVNTLREEVGGSRGTASSTPCTSKIRRSPVQTFQTTRSSPR